MALETGVFLMVLASSMMHALWNMAARKVKGDQTVLFIGQIIPTIMFLPILPFATTGLPFLPAFPWVIATGVIHVFYIWSLGAMYSQVGGNVSVVYPVARGTGVALTVLLASPLLDESLSIQAYFGIAFVIVGVIAMGLSSKSRALCALSTRAVVHPTAVSTAKLKELESVSSEKDGNDFVSNTELMAVTSTTTNDIAASTTCPQTSASASDSLGEVVDEAARLPDQVAPSKKPSPWMALGFALLTGLFISAYSLVDKVGVGLMNPIFFMFGMLVVELLLFVPYNLLSSKRREACRQTLRERKKYCFLVGVGSMGTYFIILYAFTLSHASYIVAIRECAVVWGAIFGVLFLKERVTVAMLFGTVLIVTGMILMKIDASE